MTAHASHTAPAASTAGLILSLAASLPRDARALRRRATAIAARLARPHARAVDNRAADTLALLLELADTDQSGFAEDNCLDLDFDA